MKITTASLGEVRLALIESSATLAAQEKSAAEVVAAREASRATVRGLQGAFDIAAAGEDSSIEMKIVLTVVALLYASCWVGILSRAGRAGRRRGK
jgi:hypothetical protein